MIFSEKIRRLRNRNRCFSTNGTNLTNELCLYHSDCPTQKKLSLANSKLNFIKAYCTPTENNITQLRILDALREINTIPDCTADRGIRIILEKMSNFHDVDLHKFVEYAKHYPPRVRALAGAMLATLSKKFLAEELKETINPLSKFKISVSNRVLRHQKQFNIQ